MQTIKAIGFDIAKSVFQVHSVDADHFKCWPARADSRSRNWIDASLVWSLNLPAQRLELTR
jgi:hypothetical protein